MPRLAAAIVATLLFFSPGPSSLASDACLFELPGITSGFGARLAGVGDLQTVHGTVIGEHELDGQEPTL